MRQRLSWFLLVWLAACGTGSGTIGGITTSTTTNVQVLNASTTNIDLLQDQTVSAGNGDIAFGAASQCMQVEIVSHGLSVRPTSAHTTSTQLPSFSANERYLVPVTGGTSSLSVLSLRNSFTPLAGSGGVRLINLGGTGSYDIFVTAPGAALGTPDATAVVSGTASPYFNVAAGTKQVRITANGSIQVAFDVGNVSIVAGGRYMVVIAPPATGATVARAFVFQIPANNSSC